MVTEKETEVVKPGIKTTEFWTALGTVVVTALVGLGIVAPDENSNLVAAIALAGTSITAVAYAISRSLVKREVVKKGA